MTAPDLTTRRMSAQTDIDWVHPYRSEQVTLHPGGRCYRCGGDVATEGRNCRDCMWLRVPTDVADWADDALCAQTDPEIFFPVDNHSPAAAKSVCTRCPVIAECFAYAMATRATGVWGGTTDKERTSLRRRGLA